MRGRAGRRPGGAPYAVVGACLLTLLAGRGALGAPPEQASTYYVGPGGSDRYPCTRRLPCADMAPFSSGGTAIVLRPGDSVLILPGTYRMPAMAAPEPVFTIANLRGTPARPITVAAAGPVTVTRAPDARGRHTAAEQGQELVRIANDCYLTVAGLSVIGPKGRPGYLPAARPYGGEVEIDNHAAGSPCALGAGVTVRGFTISHANNTCLKQQDEEPDEAFIANVLRDCGAPGDTLDHALYVSGPRALIQDNVVDGASGFGIHIYGRTVGGARILGNTVTHATGSGILDRGGAITALGNRTAHNGAGGFDIAGPGPNLIAGNLIEANWSGIEVNPGTPATVLNNTFYGSTSQSPLRDTQGYGPGNAFTAAITVENNIFYQASPALTLFNVPFTATVRPRVDYNDYVGVTPTWANGPRLDGGHSLYRDPLFVAPARRPWPNLALRPGSPAIGAGPPVAGAGACPRPDLGALPHAARHVPPRRGCRDLAGNP